MTETHNDLMERIAEGDKAAFATLYYDLEKPVFRFCASRLNDPFEAHDVLHEVFMEIWRSAAKFEGRSKVKTWVFGIAYRKVIDVLRKRGRLEVSDSIPDMADDSVDTEASITAGQEAEHVRHCVEELSDDHRLAVSLAFYEDMSYGEISKIAGVPEGTIKTRIYHAKKLLLWCLSMRMRETTS